MSCKFQLVDFYVVDDILPSTQLKQFTIKSVPLSNIDVHYTHNLPRNLSFKDHYSVFMRLKASTYQINIVNLYKTCSSSVEKTKDSEGNITFPVFSFPCQIFNFCVQKLFLYSYDNCCSKIQNVYLTIFIKEKLKVGLKSKFYFFLNFDP